jgi:pantetheine-phosphate adenylyltransferase
MQVAVGGTFDPVHDGHRNLLRRAFELGEVTVGLTSDELAREMRPHGRHVRAFEDRRRDLHDELREFAERHGRSAEIRRLDSPTGIATEPPFDALVVSPETETGGDRINEIRAERGLEPLRIEVVPHRRAEDGEIISSTRIVRGEIDEHGNLTPEAEARTADGAG